MNQDKHNLYSTTWKIIDELQGTTDAWSFKHYPFMLLFYRFLSTNIVNYVHDNYSIDYVKLSDEESLNYKTKITEDNDFFILPSKLFHNIVKNEIKSIYLNVILGSIFDEIETSSKHKLSGIFKDFDSKSNILGETDKDRSAKLSKLLKCINKLNHDNINETEYDTFGDIYEFLISNYARTSGRLGGVYFTPNTLSTLLSKIVSLYISNPNNIYDPTCGTGSLLLNYLKSNPNVAVYGQEISPISINLCRMNMILHNIQNSFLTLGDTLTKPIANSENKFDIILSNPPFKTKWDSDAIKKDDKRFNMLPVLPPKDKADFAFILHSLYTLNEKGIAAIVISPGILNRGNEEQEIRKYLVEHNLIDTIMILPKDLFYGTSINVCVMTLRKNKSDDNILFIDATSEYNKINTKVELSEDNINNIITLVKERKTIDHKAYLASSKEIENKLYNLSPTSYIRSDKNVAVTKDIKITETLEEVLNKKQELILKLTNLTKEIDTFIEKTEDEIEYDTLENFAISIRTGLNPRQYFSFISESNHYYITPREMQDHTIKVTSQTKKIDNKAKERINGYSHYEPGDILFSLSEAQIKTALVGKEHNDYDINESIYIIKPNLKLIEPNYLMYLLESDFFKEQVNRNLSYGKIIKIGIKKFRTLSIPKIDINKQKHISKMLDNLSTIRNQLHDLHIKESKLLLNEINTYNNIIFKANAKE